MQRRLTILWVGILMLALAACGTVATPDWAVVEDHAEESSEDEEIGLESLTEAVEEEADEAEVAVTEVAALEAAQTEQATVEITEEATAEATEVVTEVATEEVTAEATEVITEAATEVVTEEATEEATAEVTEAATEEGVAGGEAVAAEQDFAQLISSAIAEGDPEAGMTVFNTSYETSSGVWMCTNCHSVDESQQRLIGPGLWGLHERAVERVEEAPADDPVTYVRNSIIYTNDYIVPADEGGPYPANLMPGNYEELLTEQELTDLVAYILTLGNEN